MGAHDAIDDEGPHRGGLGGAVLEIVQRGGADGEPVLVLLVPLRDARIEIPAVVVETGRVGDALDAVERVPFELPEPDDDVGHLDAGVVDVVLDFDRRVAEPEHPHERVAERRVPEVPDVGRLVGIDGGVLDDGLGLVSAKGGDFAADA